MRTIWLLDIDGVLIHPGGYQAALKATVNHFSRAMGLGDLAPDDEAIRVFEACGVTSEWDSAPLCAAVLLVEAAQADPGLQFDFDFWRSVERVRARRIGPLEMHHDLPARYGALARRVAETRRPGEYPGEVTLRVLTQETLPAARLDGRSEALTGALRHLLADTRDFPHAPGMYVFQHYALGSRVFTETYRRPASFEADGFLASHDRPALSSAGRRRLEALMAGGLRASILTARPSHAPRDLSPQPSGYSPEAELAASLVGLESLPVIGFGRLEWLGRETGHHPEEFLKPSPVHALAAIGAALGVDESRSLLDGYRLAVSGELDSIWERLRGEEVSLHVFEDSTGGVLAAQAAGEHLQRVGVPTEVHAWGVSTHADKAQALERLGARVLPTIDAAIEAASLVVA